MRVVVDIDGVLADEPYPGAVYSNEAGWDYSKCVPVPGAVEALRELKAEGHTITLYTARPPQWEAKTREWLDKHGFVYDRLVMGKPSGDIYIDDRGFHFLQWDDLEMIRIESQLEREKA